MKMVADRRRHAAYQQALVRSFLGMSISITLNDLEP